MPIDIKLYTAADKDGCVNAFKSNVPLYFTEGEVADFASFLERVALRDEGMSRTHYYVVHTADGIIGCGGFGDKDGTGILTLAWGLLHSDYHKQGIGALLLRHRLEEIAKRYPASPVFIDTTQYSYGFFERYGFVTEKITNDFYAEGMHRYDMRLELNQSK